MALEPRPEYLNSIARPVRLFSEFATGFRMIFASFTHTPSELMFRWKNSDTGPSSLCALAAHVRVNDLLSEGSLSEEDERADHSPCWVPGHAA